jgi:hypothetical protein
VTFWERLSQPLNVGERLVLVLGWFLFFYHILFA